MDRIKLFSYNWIIQDATDLIIDVGDVDSFFPLENLKHNFSTKVYRSRVGTTTSKIIFDLKTSTPIDSCIIKGHAIDGLGATVVTLEASGTLDFNIPLINETLTLKALYNLGYKFFSEVSARYWRITLENTGDYVELANIFLGKTTFLTENNINFGWKIKNSENNKITKTNMVKSLLIN